MDELEQKQYEDLRDKLSDVIDGQAYDDIIPALAHLFAIAGLTSGHSRELIRGYICSVVDETYNELDSDDQPIQ